MSKLQCVRCLRKQGDVDRAHLFLCAGCAKLYGDQAFRGSPPLFTRDMGDGRCESCDKPLPLAYYQWLLCGYCTRVVQSYRKGRISGSYALAELTAALSGRSPALELVDADPVLIQATSRRGRKRELATTLDIDAREAGGPRLFWVELKSGPTALADMSEFQLDCSDCDDIMNAVRVSKAPALLAHVQVVSSPEPPTMRFVGHGLWWTDLQSFADSFKETRARRGNERKQAAYFDVKCFRGLEQLREHLAGPAFAKSLARAHAGECPQLYKKKITKKKTKKKKAKK